VHEPPELVERFGVLAARFAAACVSDHSQRPNSRPTRPEPPPLPPDPPPPAPSPK
jgi:hypothetical protein